MIHTGIRLPQKGMILFRDNLGTISLSKNEYQNERTKNIEIKRNFVKGNVADGKINLSYVPSE